MFEPDDGGRRALVTLTYRVDVARREEFLVFLRETFEFLEGQGGVHVSLYESVDEPGLFQEVIFYDTVSAYASDQVRLGRDPTMKAIVDRRGSFADGKVETRRLLWVEVFPPPPR